MGIKERRETEKKVMQGLILKTAMKLFVDKGFDNISIRRIAGKIEYSPATIYLYYKDKNEILYALHDMGFEKLYERQQAMLSIKDPWKRLREHGKVYILFAIENPEFYDLMFIMRAPVAKIKEKKKWERGLRSYDFLKENVKQCIEDGYLPKTDLDVVTFAFWSLTHGIVSLMIRERCIMFPEEHLPVIAEGALDFILNGIMHRKK